LPPESAAIASVLAGRAPARVPCGEFYIEQGLARQLIHDVSPARSRDAGAKQPFEWHPEESQVLALAAETLGLDYICVHSIPEADSSWRGPRPQDVAYLARRGFFVFAFVDGGFSRLCRDWGFERTLAFAANRPGEAKHTVLGLAQEESEEALRVMDMGAQGFMIGEDFAYDRGLLMHERLVREIIFPELEHWANIAHAPVVLHCDGDMSRVAGSLPGTGIAGLHSLERTGSANSGTYAALGRRGIALLGGLAHNVLGADGSQPEHPRQDTPGAAQAAHELIAEFRGLPYVFGSSAGVLDDSLDPGAVVSAYGAWRAQA